MGWENKMKKVIKTITYIAVMLVSSVSFGFSDEQSEIEEVWTKWLSKATQDPARYIKEYISDYIEPQANDQQLLTLIDLGAGNGRNFKQQLEEGWQIHAYDAGKESIATLENTYLQEVSSGALITQYTMFEQIKTLPQADMIIAINSMPYIKSKQDFFKFFEQMKQAAKPGGLVVFTVFGDEHYPLMETFDPKWPKILRFSPSEIQALTQQDGFDLIELDNCVKYNPQMEQAYHVKQFSNFVRIVLRKKHSF